MEDSLVRASAGAPSDVALGGGSSPRLTAPAGFTARSCLGRYVGCTERIPAQPGGAIKVSESRSDGIVA